MRSSIVKFGQGFYVPYHLKIHFTSWSISAMTFPEITQWSPYYLIASVVSVVKRIDYLVLYYISKQSFVSSGSLLLHLRSSCILYLHASYKLLDV